MLGLLLPNRSSSVSAEPEVAHRLAGLGVTHLSLLCDRDTTLVVLEGWAFDPAGSAAEAATLLGADGGQCRTFRLLAHVSLPAVPTSEVGSRHEVTEGGIPR
jgi:hypothetical protein